MLISYDPDETLAAIVSEIKKHAITNPIFYVRDFVFNDIEDAVAWVDLKCRVGRRVQYKHVGKNKFELIDVFPYPPLTLCEKFADECIQRNKEQISESAPMYFLIRGVVYDEQEARKEIIAQLEEQGGSFAGSYEKPLQDPHPKLKRKIIKVVLVELNIFDLVKEGIVFLVYEELSE